MSSPALPQMDGHLQASAALVEFFRQSQVLPRIESDEKGFRHVEIRAYVKPISPEETIIAGISVRDAKGLLPLEDAVREWQERYKAMDAHLDTVPAGHSNEQLGEWNAKHDELFLALDTAERALAAIDLPKEAPCPPSA